MLAQRGIEFCCGKPGVSRLLALDEQLLLHRGDGAQLFEPRLDRTHRLLPFDAQLVLRRALGDGDFHLPALHHEREHVTALHVTALPSCHPPLASEGRRVGCVGVLAQVRRCVWCTSLCARHGVARTPRRILWTTSNARSKRWQILETQTALSSILTNKVEQPGTVQMSGDVADPEEFGMPPEETRANIEKHVRRLAPPAEFLQRGKELIGTPGRGGLRWPWQRSFCKVVGQSLGGTDASGAWRWLEADRDARAIVASRFVEEQESGVTETMLAYVAGADQLLDPRRPRRWGLLRAVADELNTHAAKSEDVHLDQATRDYHLGACWAWCPHLSPRIGIAKHPHARLPLAWRPVPGTCGAQTICTTWWGRFSDFVLCSSPSARRHAVTSSRPFGTRRAQSHSPASGKVPSPRFGACTHVRPSIMEPSTRQTRHGV